MYGTYQNISTALPALMRNVLTGHVIESRAGRTREVMHSTILLVRPCEREIVHPDRRALYPAQIAETMWILAGRNDVEWLSHYLPRAAEFSDDGSVWRGGYGPRLRGRGSDNDPMDEIIMMLREDPDTRRAVINIYDNREDLGVDSKDIPCNTLLHFIRNRMGGLDLAVMVRSNDLMWGWSGINAFEWSAVLEIVAHYAGMEPGQLVFHQSSLHLYERSWAKAERIVKTGQVDDHLLLPWSPRFSPGDRGLGALIDEWFRIERLIRCGSQLKSAIKITSFPEPLMRSWLWVLWSWQFGKVAQVIEGTVQEMALTQSPGWADRVTAPLTKMAAYIADLHERKDKAYGDSWKRRGEKVAIQANIARKVDRLGVSDDDETELDTAVDLLVYLIKYRGWLLNHTETENEWVRAELAKLEKNMLNRLRYPGSESIEAIRERFDKLLGRGDEIDGEKMRLVTTMAEESWLLVKSLWEEREREAAELRKALWKGQGATS